MEIEEFRASVDAWLQQNSSALRPGPGADETLDGQMAQLANVKRLTYEAGWMRWGWPNARGRTRRVDTPTGLSRRGPDLAGTWSSQASTR